MQDSMDLLVDSTSTLLDSTNLILRASVVNESTGPGFFEKFTSNSLFPYFLLALFLMCLIYFAIENVAGGIRNVLKNPRLLTKEEKYDLEEDLSTYQATQSTLKYIIPVSVLAYFLYIAVAGTYMQGYVMEWLNLLVRWAHMVAGIMWIGASFYFVFLENNLNRTKNLRSELAGNLWAVHGGGFYYLEKYKVAPRAIPEELHWFKYEAYFTFLTGMSLLFVVYYMDARAYLIDASIMDLAIPTAILIGLGSISIGWLVYDQMCKSRLVNVPLLFAAIGFCLFTCMAYFLCQVFNPRAAYIHMGAMIGAIMVGNVYFNIIPAQKAMVKSAIIGKPLDASLGKIAGQRSYHNNYFTLPVLFIMISNHFPSTFGHQYNWAILAGIALTSAGIKHFWNMAEKGVVMNKLLAISIVGLFALAFVVSPVFERQLDMAIPVSFAEANEVIQARCVQCHSANPTDDVWTMAPNGVMYDTPEQIAFMADKIMTRAVRSKNMPQGNKTNMTDEERVILKRWIMQGAKIE